MPYVVIFAGCYALAFIFVHFRLATQAAHLRSRLKANGISQESFDANLRREMPFTKEMLIRLWAPFVYSAIPAALISLGYFLIA